MLCCRGPRDPGQASAPAWPLPDRSWALNGPLLLLLLPRWSSSSRGSGLGLMIMGASRIRRPPGWCGVHTAHASGGPWLPSGAPRSALLHAPRRRPQHPHRVGLDG
jgi:hypothetical protein